MTLVFVDQGEAIALEYLVNRDSPENLVLRLFQNDVTDGLTAAQIEALTQSDMTEAGFTGYSSIELTGGSWNAASGDDPSDIDFAQQEFTATADVTPQTIYGYYYTRASGGEMVAFEYFDSPVTVEFENDTIRVTPQITAADTQD